MDAQLAAQNNQRVGHGANDRLGVRPRFADGLLGAFEGVDIHQHQHCPVHLVLEAQVGTHAQRIPAPVFVPHLLLGLAHGVNDAGNESLQVGQLEIVPEGAERTPHVGSQQVERFFGFGGEAVDGQVSFEQHDGQVGGALEVHQVAVELVEHDVPSRHFLIHSGELFVGGLELFLRGFQFFVDALKFLVGGSDFFVGGLDLFVGRFVLFLDGLKIIARLGLFAFQFGDPPVGGSQFTAHPVRLSEGTGSNLGRLQRFQPATITPSAVGCFLRSFGRQPARSNRFLEENQITPFLEVLERDDFQIGGARQAVLLHAHIPPAHHFAFMLRLVERRAQGQQQTFARHLQDVEAGPAGGRF